jgi:hypothetical protein
MNRFMKRLTALEQAERSGPRFPDMTPALMLCYATAEERAEWEAAGRLELDRATFETAIACTYGPEASRTASI